MVNNECCAQWELIKENEVYKEYERNGRLFVLPYAVGETLYEITNDSQEPIEIFFADVKEILQSIIHDEPNNVIFRTKEEAQLKINERKMKMSDLIFKGRIEANMCIGLTSEQANTLKEKLQEKSDFVKSQKSRRSGRLSVAEINEVINYMTDATAKTVQGK